MARRQMLWYPCVLCESGSLNSVRALWMFDPEFKNNVALNRPCAQRWNTAKANAPRPHSMIMYPI